MGLGAFINLNGRNQACYEVLDAKENDNAEKLRTKVDNMFFDLSRRIKNYEINGKKVKAWLFMPDNGPGNLKFARDM